MAIQVTAISFFFPSLETILLSLYLKKIWNEL